MHSYLLQEETRLDGTHKMEAANAILAAGSASSSSTAGTTLVVTGLKISLEILEFILK
jgi:hypothetical protein